MVKFLKDHGVIVSQGDTLIMPLEIYNNDGSLYQIQTGDVVKFACKENFEDENPLIEVTIDNTTLLLELSKEETKKLKPGVAYHYDVRVERSGNVHTFISGVITSVAVAHNN